MLYRITSFTIVRATMVCIYLIPPLFRNTLSLIVVLFRNTLYFQASTLEPLLLTPQGEFKSSAGHFPGVISKLPLRPVESPEERLCTFSDSRSCRFRFVYSYDEFNNAVIRAQETKRCPAALNVLGRRRGALM